MSKKKKNKNKKSSKVNNNKDKKKNYSKGKVKRLIKNFFSIFSSAKDKASKVEEMKDKSSQINYKLSQRLDSAGHTELAQKVAEWPVENKGFFRKILSSFAAKPLGYKLKLLGGGAAGSVLLFGVIAFGLIWYRGTDVILLDELSGEKETPVLSLSKQEQTEYGVGTDTKWLALRIDETEEDVKFRALGAQNKIDVSPAFDYSVELTSDGRGLQVVPKSELKPGTNYTVTLRKGTMFTNGASLEKDFVWTFRTEPEFAVTGITPRDGSKSAPVDTTIEVEMNYKNYNTEAFEDYFSITPDLGGRFEKHGKKIVFIPEDNLVPNSRFTVEVKKGFENDEGQALEYNYVSNFYTSHQDSDGKYIEYPQIYWTERAPLLSVTQDAWLGLSTIDVNSSTDFTLYSTSVEGLTDIMSDFQWEINRKPKDIEKVQTFSKRPEDVDFFNVDFPDYGIYFLEAYNREYDGSLYKFLVYSPVGVVSSNSHNNSKNWVYDMNEKKPVSGATVNYYNLDQSQDTIYVDTTNQYGFSEYDKDSVDLVVADYSGNYAVKWVDAPRSNIFGFGPYGGYYWNEMDTETRAFIFTDKPLYKPGDTVKYKVIVREEDDMNYEVPENEEISVRLGNGFVRWSGTEKVPFYEEKLEVSSDFGTAESEFVLPQNVETGYERLSVFRDGSVLGSTNLRISEYSKPKYELNVDLDNSYAFSGDTVEISMSGEDYSGNPASGLEVTLSISKSELYNSNWYDSKSDVDSAYGGYNRDSISRETFTLDSNGKASFSLDVDVSDTEKAIGMYEVDLYAPDEYMTGDYSKLIVADDPVGLFAMADKRHVGSGEDNSVKFRTSNLWDFEEEGGIRIEATVERNWTEWVESEEEYYNPATKATVPVYESERNSEIVLENEELVTDDDGLADLDLTDLQKGDYTIETVYYNEDNEITKTFDSVFFVYGPPSDSDAVYGDWGSAIDIFKIYTDQDEYEIGDEAEISIKTTLEGKGLVMFKRGDVYDWKEVDLSSGLVEIQQDITEEMAPEVEVCVWGIKEYNSFEYGYKNISKEYLSNIFEHRCNRIIVNQDYGELKVDVSSDKEVYGPGEKVSLDVRVTDGEGKGVKSEVTIDVVDKALMSLVEDDDTGYEFGVHRFFYELVTQRTSVEGSMFDYHFASFGGAGSGGDGPSRDTFADVANWTGTVKTDASGRGNLVFTLPDNLTTWVVRSLAVSEDTWVGEGISEFRTNKEIFVDTKTPQFLRSDDNLELDLTVANYSGSNVSGNLRVKCEKCVNTESTEEVSIPKDSRRSVKSDIQPKDGVDEVTVVVDLDSGGQSIDSVEWSIPVIPSGFVTADTKSLLMEEGEEESEIEFSIPEEANLNGSDLNITISKSFVNEWALVPVDPSIRSSVELSNSVVHNTIFYKYHDEIKPNQDKDVYEKKIESALNMMKQNQAESGGFGWFDYDAVNYELSSYVGVAYGLAKDAGIETDDSVMNNLALYLKDGLDSDETSIDEKIYAVYALSVMGENDVLPYAVWLKENPEEYSDSPLNVAHLMLALQWLGDMGDGLSLVPYLEDSANINKRSATWQDSDVSFRIVKSKDYTTGVVYLALSEYGEIELSKLARNWLVDNNVSVYGNDFDAVNTFYALTESNIDNLESRKQVNKVTININGQDYRTVDVGGNENFVGKADLKIPARYLKSGENKIKIYRSGGGDLYVISNLEYFSEDLPAGDIEFTIKRKFIDYYTGQEISSAQKGQVVKIRTDVTVDRDAANLVVRDLMPSGFEPVRFTLGDYDSIIEKWWQWDSSEYINRYGRVGQQQVSFYEYQVADGKTYSFEYLVVVVYEGEFNTGGAQSFIQNFEDIDGYTKQGVIEVN